MVKRIIISRCEPNPCGFGAKCIERNGQFKCMCPKGRRGVVCNEVEPNFSITLPGCKDSHDNYRKDSETWNEFCRNCSCIEGSKICKETCGNNQCNPIDESIDTCVNSKCVTMLQEEEDKCLTGHCVKRHFCIADRMLQRNNVTLDEYLETIHGIQVSKQPDVYCSSFSDDSLPENCVKIYLHFNGLLMPYGVWLSDLCRAVKSVSRAKEELHYGIECSRKVVDRNSFEQIILDVTLHVPGAREENRSKIIETLKEFETDLRTFLKRELMLEKDSGASIQVYNRPLEGYKQYDLLLLRALVYASSDINWYNSSKDWLYGEITQKLEYF
ncbi:Protein jagged-2 [Cichlidogyrus casuarinus]|uniref:Protein jagged-2 n=1 Tax=Cichlidogyrus casuarinus TaxID=1844966 RepID=A0ABD2Q1Z6_9PLAT